MIYKIGDKVMLKKLFSKKICQGTIINYKYDEGDLTFGSGAYEKYDILTDNNKVIEVNMQDLLSLYRIIK